jgi:hypothetical protein
VLVPTGGRFAHLLQVPVGAVDYEKFDSCTTRIGQGHLAALGRSYPIPRIKSLPASCIAQMYNSMRESNIAVLGSDFSISHRHFGAISLSLKSGKTMTRFSQAQNSCVLEALQCRQ